MISKLLMSPSTLEAPNRFTTRKLNANLRPLLLSSGG